MKLVQVLLIFILLFSAYSDENDEIDQCDEECEGTKDYNICYDDCIATQNNIVIIVFSCVYGVPLLAACIGIAICCHYRKRHRVKLEGYLYQGIQISENHLDQNSGSFKDKINEFQLQKWIFKEELCGEQEQKHNISTICFVATKTVRVWEVTMNGSDNFGEWKSCGRLFFQPEQLLIRIVKEYLMKSWEGDWKYRIYSGSYDEKQNVFTGTWQYDNNSNSSYSWILQNQSVESIEDVDEKVKV